MITAIVGLNWGDEGKGRFTDYLAGEAAYVVRFQGGDNAGHTIVNDRGKFVLHHIPSGIFNPGCCNIIASGSVINPATFIHEIKALQQRGIETGRIVISDRAVLTLPYHIALEKGEEQRLGIRKYGSTMSGIAPSYSDRFLKKSIQAGELFYPDYLKERLQQILDYKKFIYASTYPDFKIDSKKITDWILHYGEQLKPYIKDTRPYIEDGLQSGKPMLLEAQLGALRDIHHGIYPYTTSSPVLASFACASLPLPPGKLTGVLGITKAYATCVGEGPFITEMEEKEAAALRDKAGEYGAKTGRPRRIGYFDAVATGYGIYLQGASEIGLTCLDILSGYTKLKICTGYQTCNKLLSAFPINPGLANTTPEYLELEGWQEDITGITEYSQLPLQARIYVETIEKLSGVPVSYISTGPQRAAMLKKPVSR